MPAVPSPAAGQPVLRVPAEERLFSLVLALVSSQRGLTKAEILASVQGYRQRVEADGESASLDRQFERDKDDLRELGVPLETVDDPGDPGNNQNLRYRIPKGAYDLPAELTFTPDEQRLLTLAGLIWREGSLSTASRRALIKLASLGVDTASPLLGFSPRVRSTDPSFAPLGRAVELGQVVSFDYLMPGRAAPLRRTVLPLAVVSVEGRWHLYGRDEDRGDPRTFLLRRIVGAVRPTGRSVPVDAAAHHADEARRGLEAVYDRNSARIAVEPDSDAALRLRGRGPVPAEGAPATDGVLELHYLDLELLADELAGFGPEVRVLEPAALRDAVRTRLERVLAAHAEAAA